MRRTATLAFMATLTFAAFGCGKSDPKVSVADLDKVLEIFETTLNERPAVDVRAAVKEDGNGAPAGNGKVAGNGKPAGNGAPQPNNGGLPAVKENPKANQEFLKKFAGNLNDAKIVEDPVGVRLNADGSIEGFVDKDQNMQMSGAEEKSLFKIQIDTESNPPRLIASQTVEGDTYHRDRRYRYRPGGMFMGYMLGSMMGRQSGYYSGARAGSRPRFSGMNMSPRGYHTSAVSKARTAAKARTRSSGARRGGSRGFRGGK